MCESRKPISAKGRLDDIWRDCRHHGRERVPATSRLRATRLAPFASSDTERALGPTRKRAPPFTETTCLQASKPPGRLRQTSGTVAVLIPCRRNAPFPCPRAAGFPCPLSAAAIQGIAGDVCRMPCLHGDATDKASNAANGGPPRQRFNVSRGALGYGTINSRHHSYSTCRPMGTVDSGIIGARQRD